MRFIILFTLSTKAIRLFKIAKEIRKKKALIYYQRTYVLEDLKRNILQNIGTTTPVEKYWVINYFDIENLFKF